MRQDRILCTLPGLDLFPPPFGAAVCVCFLVCVTVCHANTAVNARGCSTTLFQLILTFFFLNVKQYEAEI